MRRLRFDVPRQVEYGVSIEVTAYEIAPASTTVALFMTREYLGDATSTWPLTILDLSTVRGVPSGLGLQARPVSWHVRVASGALPSKQTPYTKNVAFTPLPWVVSGAGGQQFSFADRLVFHWRPQ